MHDLPTHGQAHEPDIERKEYLRRRQAAFTPESEAYLARLACRSLERPQSLPRFSAWPHQKMSLASL
jgi:hypothetical protein